MTSETRPPRVGVASATSTSREAPCAPVSTTSSSHCTSPSTSCWDLTQEAGVPAASRGCRTPNWSVWRWPRCCWAATASTAGCGPAMAGWAICSRTAQPAGRQQAAAAARWLLDQVLTYLAVQTPGVHDTVRLLDATPVPCAASRETLQRSALRGIADYGWCPSHSRWYWGLKLDVLTIPTAARSPGAWPAPSWASARSPWPCWTEAASSPARSLSVTRAWPAPRSSGTCPAWRRSWSARPPR